MLHLVIGSCLPLALALSGDTILTDTAATKKDRPSPSWSVGAAYLRVGTSRLGLGAFNDVLTRNGRPAFGEGASMVGFSAHARLGRFLLGATGETSLPHRRVANGWMTQLSAGLATFDAGVAVYERGSTMIATMGSLGIRKTGLRLEAQGDFSYDDGVSNPARGVTLSSRSGVAQGGLLLEQRLRAPRIGAIALSAQVGVSSPFGGASTVAGESRVAGTPAPQSGAYLRVAVGKPLRHRSEAFNAVVAAVLSMVGR